MHPTKPRLTRSYAPAPTGQVHFYDSGGEGTPLLMLHQSPSSSLDYALTFPAFARAGQRVIAVDTPGMGMSDTPVKEPTTLDYAEAANAVLTHLGVNRAHVFGHHTGAQIAAELAAGNPERMGKVILYGVPMMTPDEMPGRWTAIVPWEREGRIHKPQAGGGHLTEQFQRIERVCEPAVAQRLILTALMAGPDWWYGHNAALTYDMTDALKAIAAPLLLLSSEGEMLHSCTLAAHTLRPDATLVTLKTDGVFAMDSDPEELVAEVMRFLTAE